MQSIAFQDQSQCFSMANNNRLFGHFIWFLIFGVTDPPIDNVTAG